MIPGAITISTQVFCVLNNFRQSQVTWQLDGTLMSLTRNSACFCVRLRFLSESALNLYTKFCGVKVSTFCFYFWTHPMYNVREGMLKCNALSKMMHQDCTESSKRCVKHLHTQGLTEAVVLANFANSYWHRYFYCDLCPSCYTAACFHIDFASISQLPYMLQGHPSAVYQRNS